MSTDHSDRVPSALASIGSYVAIGDSFTQGPGCRPGNRWADRLAAALRTGSPNLEYLNLAVDGATSDRVLLQVEEATPMRPEFATVVCGANDVLMSVRPDVDRYDRNFNAIVDRLEAANPGVVVMTATVPSNWQALEVRPRTKRRVIDSLRALNDRTREIAGRRRLKYVEVELHPKLHDPDNFASDGLHPSELGHERVSGEFIRVAAEMLAARPGATAENAGENGTGTAGREEERTV